MKMYLNKLTNQMVGVIPNSKITAEVKNRGKVTICKIRSIYRHNDEPEMINFDNLKPLTTKERDAMVKKIIASWS
jgi:hypothetical protein